MRRRLELNFRGGEVDSVTNMPCRNQVPRDTYCLNATASFRVNIHNERNPLERMRELERQIKDAITEGHLMQALLDLDDKTPITIEEGSVRTRIIPSGAGLFNTGVSSTTAGMYAIGVLVGVGILYFIFLKFCNCFSCCSGAPVADEEGGGKKPTKSKKPEPPGSKKDDKEEPKKKMFGIF